MTLILLPVELFIAKKHFPLEVGHKQQLIEEGPGDAIILGDVRHFPVDALIEPRQHDNLNTGLGISIGSSHKFHRVASGWGWMVMNRNDSYWDHHHTTTRGFDETVNWHLKSAQISVRFSTKGAGIGVITALAKGPASLLHRPRMAVQSQIRLLR